MEIPLRELKRIHLRCDDTGRVTLIIIHKKGGEGKILHPGDMIVFENTTEEKL